MGIDELIALAVLFRMFDRIGGKPKITIEITMI
jgi:hypothetical protein